MRKRSSDLQMIAELGFDHYTVGTKTQGSAAFAEITIVYTGFYGELVRLYNSSNYDAYVKINSLGAFTLPAGDILSIIFDNITKLEIKSASGGNDTVVEASVWGRTDVDAA